jgi:hypothetical protein
MWICKNHLVIKMNKKIYVQAPLPYDYGALVPAITEELLRLHYQKHHAAYVNGANNILTKFDKARIENTDVGTRAISKEFSFNLGGLFLHEKFWKNMTPIGKGGGKPGGKIGDALTRISAPSSVSRRSSARRRPPARVAVGLSSPIAASLIES